MMKSAACQKYVLMGPHEVLRLPGLHGKGVSDFLHPFQDAILLERREQPWRKPEDAKFGFGMWLRARLSRRR